MVKFQLSLFLCLHAVFISSVTSTSSSSDKRQLRRALEEEQKSDADDESSTKTDTHKLACKYRLADKQAENDVKLVGEAYEALESVTNYKVADEDGPTAAKCVGGFAGGYPCSNVDLLSVLDIDELEAGNLPISTNSVNDLWGWTDELSGREFAMIGLSSGTVFVEITDPYNPIVTGNLPTMGNPNDDGNFWRDIKTFDNYAVIVSEINGHGMQVFDLTELLSAPPNTVFSNSAYFDGFGSAHNVFVNEDTAFAYSIGSNKCSGGLYIVDMSDPLDPTFAGCYGDDGYTHDVQCVIYKGPDSEYVGREICFASNEDTITIVDVTDKSNMVELSRQGYGGSFYTHQGWLTEDQAYFIFNDELDELASFIFGKTKTRVMDVSDLTNQKYAGTHNGRSAATDHNHYVKGDYLYQANYRAGFNLLKIIDASKATFSQEGYFDIFPSSDSFNFNGAWSNYPYFPSGSIIVSGIEQGLFVLRSNIPECFDSLLPLSFEGKSYSCAIIASNDLCDDEVAASHCPGSCGACDDYGCSDTDSPFVTPNGVTRDCEFLAGLPSDLIAEYCANELAFTTCRETCATC